MEITNLKKNPEFLVQAQNLIEKSFEYQPPNQFDIDFYPLFNKKNFENCFILIKDDDVIAHIGCLERNFLINNKSFPILMLGGISVLESHRGKGVFKTLFNHILEIKKNITAYFLWSDKLDMYKKFHFYPCIELFSYAKINSLSEVDVQKKKFRDLEKGQLNFIQQSYKNSEEIRINRDQDVWAELSKINSCDIFLIYRDNILDNYFIVNKGQDLKGIVHEYGYLDLKTLSLIQNYGQVWSPIHYPQKNPETLFGASVKAGNKLLFSDLISEISPLNITDISETEISFAFNAEQFTIPHVDFLQGVFGPAKFQEFKVPSFNICGLDSI